MLIYVFQSNDGHSVNVSLKTSANTAGDNNFNILDVQDSSTDSPQDIAWGLNYQQGEVHQVGDFITMANNLNIGLVEIDTTTGNNSVLVTANVDYPGGEGIGEENI